jgi:CRP-like cAMP-binding protein
MHFFDRLEPVDLPRTFSLARLNAPIEHVYFPEAGIGSVIAVSPEGNKVESGLFGRDGFSPVQSLVGTSAQGHEIVMQVSGHGHRIDMGSFRQAMNASPAFTNLMMRYAQTLSTQVSFTSLSNALHHVDERLARWILMCHDRVDGDEIGLTHDYISIMLAVRRPSVTDALHVLEGNGFITSVRGRVIVRNRGALEKFAHDAYGRPEEEYRRLIGEMDVSPSKVVASPA